jgi:hypothetical protein
MTELDSVKVQCHAMQVILSFVFLSMVLFVLKRDEGGSEDYVQSFSNCGAGSGSFLMPNNECVTDAQRDQWNQNTDDDADDCSRIHPGFS